MSTNETQHSRAKFALHEKPGEEPWVVLSVLLPAKYDSSTSTFHHLASAPTSGTEYTLFVPSKDLLTSIIEEASNALLALTRAEFRREKPAKDEPEGQEAGGSIIWPD